MASRKRRTLSGVPVVSFYRGGPRAPQDDPFPACLQAILEHGRDDLGLAAELGTRDPWHDVHVYLMGVTGSSFRVMWDPAGWAFGIMDISSMAPDALEPFRQGCANAGFTCEFLLRLDYAASLGVRQDDDPDEETFRSRIVRSIDRGMPVISFGVVGPPEAGLITGYDEAGDVLIGRTFFQDDPEFTADLAQEPDGRYRKRDWYASIQGIIVLTGRQPRPADLDAARRSLRLALELMQTPVVRGRKAGLAALTSWAETMMKPADHGAADDAAVVHRKELHCGNGGTLAEARAWGARYLHILAGRFPEAADDLRAAAGCFDDIHDLVWAIWEFTDGRDKGADEAVRRFRDPGARGRIVPLLRLARARDAEAVRHLEGALGTLDRKAGLGPGLRPAANPAARVRATAHSARILDVPELGWGKGRDCTFIGAVEAATSVTGSPLAYADMMGLTGLAFRVRWSNGNTLAGWSQSSACGEFMEEFEDLIRATGRGLDAVFGDAAAPDAAKEIRTAIDAGLPFIGPVAGPDVAVVYGYKNGGRTVLAHTYETPERREYRLKDLGDWRIFLGGQGEPRPALEVLAHSLRTAVRNWERGKSDAHYRGYGKEWHYGRQAVDEWMADLASASTLSPGDAAHLADVSAFCFLSLLDARNAAAEYLSARAHLLWGEARESLERASAAYRSEAALLAEAVPAVTAATGPRRAGAPEALAATRAALERALPCEEQAVEAIRRALAAYEADASVEADAHPGERMVLRDVPRIGYGTHLCPFPGSLHAVLEYIGDKRDYDWLMGVTGACFRRFWEKDDGGNVDLMYLAPEPYERAAAALHYEIRRVPRDKAAMVAAIKESIARGRPVITLGPIGPPEAGIVTGYDRGGEVLIGWSYFADPSRGYFDRIDWYEKQEGEMGGALVLGDSFRWGGDDPRTALLKSLRFAVDLARVPTRACAPRHLSGLAAYDGWADGLEVDADYPAGDPAVLATRVMVHGDQCVMLEERRSAAAYLRQMTSTAPEAEAEMCAAADLYERIAALGARVWLWGHDMGPDAQQGLADAAARRGIAAAVREARALEAAAVDLLERAAAAMDAA